MRSSTLAKCLLWTALIGAVAATPAPAPPPTSREAAEVWLDRAGRDIAAIPTTTVARWERFPAHRLAIWAYEASPTDARRNTAADRIRRYMAVATTQADSAQARSINLYAGADDMAEIDDLPGAAEYLAAATKPTTLPTSDDQWIRLSASSASDIGLYRAFALIRLGRGDEVDDAPCDKALAQFYLWRFEDSGHPEMADQLSAVIRLPDGLGPDKELEVRRHCLAMNGFWDQAMILAKSVKDPLERCHAVIDIGEGAALHGRKDLSTDARQSAFAEMDSGRLPEFRQAELLQDVLDMSARSADRAGVEETAVRLMKLPKRYCSDAQIAKAAAAVGDTDLYRSRIDAAAASAAGMEDTGERRSQLLEIAAAAARAGDKARVDSALASAERIGPATEDLAERRERIPTGRTRDVICAYVEAGHFDDAAALLPRVHDYPAEEARTVLAHALALQGDFQKARQLGPEFEFRVQSLAFIAVQQIKQNKPDGLADWVAKIPDPAGRAAVDIAVANAITGRRNRDFDRAMRDQ